MACSVTNRVTEQVHDTKERASHESIPPFCIPYGKNFPPPPPHVFPSFLTKTLFPLLLLAALLFTACKGPQGDPGPVINITINGQASSEDIADAINTAISGATGGGPWTVEVSGVDLTNDYAVRSLIHGIAAGLTGTFELDLSGCTDTGTSYSWGYVSGIPAADKARITALTLPASVTEITNGASSQTGAFAGFSSLTGVTATGVAALGAYAFYGCTALETLSLAAAQTIGNYAFSGCTALASLSLAAAQTIGAYAFYGCTALETLSLAAAQTIGNYAFYGTGTQALALTLGSTPPVVGEYLFYYVNVAKAVTVKRPASAAGAYGSAPSNATNDNWANAFRGGGWIGGVYQSGPVNTNVTVSFADL
jgi:hypothetical protein